MINNLVMKKNNIIPFEREASFYYRKAKKHIDNNNYIDALNYCRKAVEREPYNIEYLLNLAEVFTEMGYYEESNRILFYIIMVMNNKLSDCYFGMGCNFIGLQEYSKAKECLDKYIELEPFGEYTEEAQDLLDILQVQVMYFEEVAKQEKDLKRAYDIANKGKELLDMGYYKRSIKMLEKALAIDDTLTFAQNNLSLAYFCDGNVQKALRYSKGVLARHPLDVHANCNSAIFYNDIKDYENVNRHKEIILNLPTQDVDDLYKIAITMCELKEHSRANKMLRKLLYYRPYDIKILHYTGISYLNIGKYKQAQVCWRKIEKIDPQNYIAVFYKKQAQVMVNSNLRREFSYQYQVSQEEVLRRLKMINEIMKLDKDNLESKWSKNDEISLLLNWALGLNDMVIKKAVIHFVASFQDQKAENILRAFILKKTEPESLKKEVLGLLKQMKAREPYLAYIKNNLVGVKVNISTKGVKSKETVYNEILRLALRKIKSAYGKECEGVVKDEWLSFIKKSNEKAPIRVIKKEAWAAALEYHFCIIQGIDTTKTRIAKRYNVTISSLTANYNKLISVLKDG
jgi:tetratricopeptide (TPR) repeat protein